MHARRGGPRFRLKALATPGIYPVVSTHWSVVSGDVAIDNPSLLQTTARVTAPAPSCASPFAGNGCLATDDVMLTVNPLPTASITGPERFCPKSTATSEGRPTMSGYAWSVHRAMGPSKAGNRPLPSR